jgi:large subunit ribosomal protein L3
MQYATHGNSKAHRAAGSIGHCEFPGKVFKGKKMAGRMGNVNSTTLNQRIVQIDTEKALLYVQGNIPGPISGVVKVRDAVKKTKQQVWDLQYPTYIADSREECLSSRFQRWEGPAQDSATNDYHENDVVSGVD